MNRVKIKIEGYLLDSLFKEIIKKHINLYYIDKNRKYIILIIDYKDLSIIKNINKRNYITILKRYGLFHLFNTINIYKYLVIFFIINILFYIYISNIIYDIKVYCDNKVLKDKYIYKFKYLKGKRFFSYNEKERLRKNIINNDKNISFIEFNKEGVILNIFIKERKKINDKELNNPRDIIAKKDAMITDIYNIKGETVISKYQYVKKGDLLISGTIHNKENISGYVRSDGKVYGEVWEKVSLSIPLKEKLIYNKGFKFISIGYSVGNSNYFLFKSKDNRGISIKLFNNTLIPIGFNLYKVYKIKTIYKSYNINSASKKALQIINKKYKKRNIISTKVLKKSINNSKIDIVVLVKERCDITSYKDIDKRE